MANLGISYAFGARDTGQKAAFQGAEKNLDTLNDLMDEQNDKGEKSSKIWGKIRDRVRDFNIADIASNVRSLTGETGQLTNGLESMAVQAQTAAKPILAQMNLTAEQHRKMMGKVTSMNVGLNVSADAIAETLRAIHTAGKDSAAGIDAMSMSEKEWVKVTQTTGVSMQDYRAVLGNMIASWGASPEAAAEMVNSMMAVGKAAGVGTVGIKSMKSQMDAVDTAFERLPPSVARSADEIKSLMVSTVALSGAFKELGETDEKAMDLAQATGQMFAEQTVAIKRAELGLGSYEDSPLFKWLTMLGVGTKDAIDIIDEGSRDAVKGSLRIQEAMQQGIARGTIQAESALSGLNEALGQGAGGLAYLVGNLDRGAAALNKVNGLTVDSTNALKKYGDQAFSTGRTLQEQFDLAKELFDTRIRGISNKDVKEFVGYQRKAYSELGKDIIELGSDSTWGPLVKSLSLFKKMGLRGLFLGLTKEIGGKGAAKDAAKMGVIMDTVLGTAQQLGNELGPLMQILGQFGPLGTVAGGVAAWFMLDDRQREQIWKTIEPLFDWIGNKLRGLFDELTKSDMAVSFASSIRGIIDTAIDWGGIGARLIGSIDWQSIADNFTIALAKAFGADSVVGSLFQEPALEATKRQIGASIEEDAKRYLGDLGRAKQAMTKSEEALAAFEQKYFTGEIGEDVYQQGMSGLEAAIQNAREDIEFASSGLMDAMAAGVRDGEQLLSESMVTTIQHAIANKLPHSDPEDGPLSNQFLPTAGQQMIDMIADGMFESQPYLKGTVSQILEDSVVKTFEEYQAKMEELSQQKSLLMGVASDIVRSFGGEIKSAEFEGETINVEKRLETMINIPGMAGVVAAIVKTGADQQVILKKIYQESKRTADNIGKMKPVGGRSAESVLGG
jgi:hypothetical protein